MKTIQDVFHHYQQDLHEVETCMERFLRSDVSLIPEVIRHLIGSGGKRFRPLILLVAADIFGRGGDRRYALSAVIEFIHTATLLHDDVIDEAQTRRGKTSANNIWGNAASVLVGDYLYSKAFRIMAEDGDMSILRLIADTTNTMSEGEVFQLVKCGDVDMTEEEYLAIIEKKTSILIAAACAIGSILGGAGPSATENLRRFGLLAGSAFQITDDTLDYVAREDEFGKAIGKDLSEGKITLPLIHTLRTCGGSERDRIRDMIRQRGAADGAGEILGLIVRHGGIDYALDKARRFIEEAQRSLDPFPHNDAKESLFAVGDYVLSRRL